MSDPNEARPLDSEAEAQDEATIMPWIWGAIGLLVIVAFVGGLLFVNATHTPKHPPAAAPINKPIDQHT
jgi:hypothetical protein